MHSAFMIVESGLDVSPLLEAVKEQPGLWKEITIRQEVDGSPHHDTECIFLRWAKDKSLQSVFTEIPAIDYPALFKLPQARKLIAEVVRKVKGTELGRVLITKLLPNGVIDPHPDEGDYADYYERFHVPLESSDEDCFFVEHTPGQGEFLFMREGDLVWFNHKKKHWAVNNSTKERIHLIVDVVAPDYRVEREK